jgi:hypothetical protein
MMRYRNGLLREAILDMTKGGINGETVFFRQSNF